MNEERCLLCQILRHVDAKRFTLDQGVASAIACGMRIAISGDALPYMCSAHKAMVKKMMRDVGIEWAKREPAGVPADRTLS